MYVHAFGLVFLIMSSVDFSTHPSDHNDVIFQIHRGNCTIAPTKNNEMTLPDMGKGHRCSTPTKRSETHELRT